MRRSPRSRPRWPRRSLRGEVGASPAAGPAVDPLPCSGCGKLIDPLRAGHVAIFDLRFHYFCDVRCRHSFLGEAPASLSEARPSVGAAPSRADPVRAADEGAVRVVELDAPILDAFPPVSFDERLPDLPMLDDDRALL